MREYINQHDMKCLNAALAFRLIRDNGRMTRKQMQAQTHFSWGAVSNITSRLIESGYLKEETRVAGTTAGRTPYYLEVNGDKYCVVGLDINRSGSRGVIVNLKNEVISTLEYSTEFYNREELLDAIIKFAQKTLTLANGFEVLAVGVAMQGELDSREGISIKLPGCKDWANVPLRDILEEKLQLPVFIKHDPDCLLYASGERDDAMLLRLDKSVGMSASLNGVIFDKPGVFELGHITMVPNGLECMCGKRGCLESYASQNGMARAYGADFEKLVEDARNGVAPALKKFDEMAHTLALATANSMQLLGIFKVVLCGSSLQYKDLFFETFKSELSSLTNQKAEMSEIRVDRAALGAAFYAVDRTLDSMKL